MPCSSEGADQYRVTLSVLRDPSSSEGANQYRVTLSVLRDLSSSEGADQYRVTLLVAECPAAAQRCGTAALHSTTMPGRPRAAVLGPWEPIAAGRGSRPLSHLTTALLHCPLGTKRQQPPDPDGKLLRGRNIACLRRHTRCLCFVRRGRRENGWSRQVQSVTT